MVENKMRFLYSEKNEAFFMDETTYEQTAVPIENLGDNNQWLQEDILYDIIFYKNRVIEVIPPTFLELEVKETEPGAKGDTASGRVLKPAIVETGAKIQIPIFINEGEKIKIDTRTGEYVSRV